MAQNNSFFLFLHTSVEFFFIAILNKKDIFSSQTEFHLLVQRPYLIDQVLHEWISHFLSPWEKARMEKWKIIIIYYFRVFLTRKTSF